MTMPTGSDTKTSHEYSDSDTKTGDKTSSEESWNDAIESKQYGIWRISTLKGRPFDLKRQWQDLLSAFDLYTRLARELFAIAPGMLVIYILSKVWNGVESAVLTHLSGRLLRIIEIGLIKGEANKEGIYMAVAARLSCIVFVAVLQWWSDTNLPILRARIVHHFELYLMRARLRLDLPTAAETTSNMRANPYDAWIALETVIGFMAELLTSTSQLALITHISRSQGGSFFALLCIAKPILHACLRRNFWTLTCVADTNNPHYSRMKSLEKFSHDSYRQDFISGNLGDHIINEYEKARKKLGDTSTDEAWEQYERQPSPYREIFSEILGDLPMIYCAFTAIVNPSKFSIVSLAVLQQSEMSLRWSIHTIIYTADTFQRQVSKLKNLYAKANMPTKLESGSLPYPNPITKDHRGMGFELKDISFAYPGSKKTSNALSGLSLSVKPGQLIVIVGANGSGKSTLIKLLSRLYDPSEGTILIDGIDADEYRTFDLRQATAMFTQDHELYPLSLYENIALGHPSNSSDVVAVTKAAELGRAAEFIFKLRDGFGTILDPPRMVYDFNIPADPDHPLQKRLESLEKTVDISGGEKQRVVAARTFMHLSSGKVRFVAVDEPSSALDAEAELQLFQRLIECREGKTMVFVTHRFGHLTKHADQIICMKDGMIVESGSHGDLMSRSGEYAKLYNIQAGAFASDS